VFAIKLLGRLLPSSLSNRVFALYGVTLLLLVVGGLGLFLKYQFQRQVEDAELASVMLIEVVAQAVQDSVVIGDFDSVQKILNKGVQGSQFSSARFIATGGGTVRADNRLQGEHHAPTWLVRWVQKSLLDVNRNVSVGGKDYGILRLQFDSTAVAAGLWSLSLLALAGGAAALTAGLLLIRIALSRWLGGLERLRRTVESLGTGTARSTDLVIDNAPAEIQSLVDMINQTAGLVRERETTRRALDQQKFALDQHAIVSVTDAQGVISYANDRFCDISGFSRAELLGRNQQEIRADTHSAAYYDQIWNTVSQGQVWHGELCSRKRNGELYWVDATVVPILAEDGVTHQYITIRSDITARKEAEQARQAVNAALTERTAQLQAVLDNISQGVAMFAANKSLVFQSRRVMELLDIPPRLIGAELGEIVAYQTERGDFGDDFALVEECARPYLRALARGEETAPPTLYKRRTASGRTLEIGATTLDTGVTVRTYTDVTTYIEAQARAEQASIAKGQFLANMSHEIRTPMNAVLGLLQLLQDTAMTDTQRDYVLKTQGAARSLLGLLNDILDFSKVEAGKMTLDPRPFDLDKVLRDLAVILAPQASNQAITVRLDVDPTVPRNLIGDDMRLLQVLINLGGNAVKFTVQGDVVLRVRRVEQGASDVLLEFAMCDSGIGIAPENQQHIFNGFSQAEASTTRRFGGTGLGLAISSRLVGLLGGELTLHSVEGQGSTFSFQVRLPLATPPQATALAISAGTADPATQPKRLQGLRILVVEDNKINQMVARGLLTREGADVTVADNGQLGVAAVAAAAQPPFDAVLMDIQMPVMDGYAATRAIRHELGLTRLPIIAMTANAMASDRLVCMQAGMDDHVGKPFELDHLVATILRLCAR